MNKSGLAAASEVSAVPRRSDLFSLSVLHERFGDCLFQRHRPSPRPRLRERARRLRGRAVEGKGNEMFPDGWVADRTLFLVVSAEFAERLSRPSRVLSGLCLYHCPFLGVR